MTRFKRRRIQVVLEAYAPPEGPGLTPVPSEVDYVETVAGLQRNATPLARLGLNLGLLVAFWSPLWMEGRLGSLASVARARQADLLGRLARHRWFLMRELSFLLKIAAGTALLDAPTVRAHSGYDDAPGEAGA